MGKSVTPKYRVEYKDQEGKHISDWMVKEKGKPTEENLDKWLMDLNKSFLTGGVNEHISESLGFVPAALSAKIVEQRTGDVKAEVNHMFLAY